MWAPEQEAAQLGAGTGGCVLNAGSRSKHFSEGTLTGCVRTLSPQANPGPQPQTAGLCQPLRCLLVPSPAQPLPRGPRPVWCGWDIGRILLMKLGRILSLFFSKTKRRRHREWRPTSPRSPRRGGGLSPRGILGGHTLCLSPQPDQTQTRSSTELPQYFPSPTPVPTPLPALPLILQPAVIVWAGIHLQHQLHGEPSPAGGLRGPGAALSCPEGWRCQGSGQGWGLGPPPPGSAFLSPARCRSLGSSLKIDGLGEEAAAADPAPVPALPSQPSAAGSFLPWPFALPLPSASRRGIRLLQSMPRLHLPFQCPCRGLGWPPSLAQACKQTAEIWDVSPQKPAPDLL